MKSLKEKFGKFEMTKEEVKKVKGGVVYAVCKFGHGPEELLAGETVDDVQSLANELGYDDCTFVS
jgi:hypothetical protein